MVWVVPLSPLELSPQGPTPMLWTYGICGLIGVGKNFSPLPIQSPTSIGKRMRLH
jgi:hypothetical protein